jgi:serine/threonine protein kinase
VRAPTDELRKGAHLGRYEIIERIAVGGMAEIYLGRMRGTAGFDKLVAIKRVLPHVAIDQTFIEMFLAEARLAATLRHPNIADVFDVGVVDGSYFLTMEFIHGQDLRTIRHETQVMNKKVPLEISLSVMSGIASALSYAHTRNGPNGPLNLVHRDVSPSNILVSFDGAIKLVDFGIARAETNAAASVTRTGQLKGKIPYMSPEQCRAKQLDGRADLFSLGTCFYELTTGHRPFDGKGDFDTLERIVHGTMKRPSEIIPGYPAELEAIVMKMLANKRAQRYQHAEAIVQDLEQLQSDLGLYASAFNVGKYMRDLFPEEATRQLVPDEEDEAATLSREEPSIEIEIDIPDPMRESRVQQVSGLFQLEQPTSKLAEPPAPPSPSDQFKVVFRAPTGQIRAEPNPFSQVDVAPFQDESSTYRGDETHADLVSPFDPIAARGSDILHAIDPDLIDERDISLQTIGRLLERAATWSEAGQLEDAVIAIDLILSADRTTPGVMDLFAKNFPFMTAVFEAYLGDRSRMPALSAQIEELGDLPLDRRAAYLLSLLEGNMSANELVEKADMPIVEAYRHLSQLVLRRVVVLV